MVIRRSGRRRQEAFEMVHTSIITITVSWLCLDVGVQDATKGGAWPDGEAQRQRSARTERNLPGANKEYDIIRRS